MEAGSERSPRPYTPTWGRRRSRRHSPSKRMATVVGLDHPRQDKCPPDAWIREAPSLTDPPDRLQEVGQCTRKAA